MKVLLASLGWFLHGKLDGFLTCADNGYSEVILAVHFVDVCMYEKNVKCLGECGNGIMQNRT